MIDLFAVTDERDIHGHAVPLFDNVDFHLPVGRYALLSPTPDLHRAVIDVVSGIRPPRYGRVEISGAISWPIGRAGFVRGRTTGIDMIDLIADVHDVDRHLAAEVVTLMVSRPDALHDTVDRWPSYVRQEFIFALGLVPEFDIYVIDGPIPVDDSRFSRIWQALFEERLVGKTLILSSYRPKQLLDYCAKGLIYEGNSLRIENDLEQCIEQFPTRRPREDFGSEPAVMAGGDGGDFGF